MTSATAGGKKTTSPKKKRATKRTTSTRSKTTAKTKAVSTAGPKTAPKKKTKKSSAPKKAPAKKRATVSKTSKRTGKTATKKASTKKETTTKAAAAPAEAVATSPRKAPTAFASKAAEVMRTRKRHIIVAVLLLLGVGSSAVVGFTDAGRIDINQKISERNSRLAANVATADDLVGGIETVPVRNTSAAPDGGLIGVRQTVPTPRPVTSASGTPALPTSASSTASSSLPAAVASSLKSLPAVEETATVASQVSASTSAAEVTKPRPASTSVSSE